MATYTDNYQLTKPTYAEQADIGVVNSNMNKIDEVMHSSQISLAPAYDSTKTYAIDDVVMYELLMYKCIAPTTGVWDASKWERTTASESGGGGSAELDILGEGNGAVVSFSDGASAELAKCIAEIVPKQAGSGTPSPDNVRTISGSTSVTVTISDGETSTTKTTPLGQTVYGGQLNVLTGELTVTHGMVTIDGSGNVTSIADLGTNVRFWYAIGTGFETYPDNTEVYCNYIPCAPRNAQYQADQTEFRPFTQEYPSSGWFKLPKALVGTTSTTIKQYLSDNNIVIVAPLATPQTVQLTPQEVNSLLGQNNISADTGDIDIVYVKASAPIQPNPTGTPTAILKKLGIEGTVFEIEGGGGGSSSGINYSTTEQVIGTWIDGKPLYQITKEETINLSSNDDVKMSNVIDVSSSIIHKFDVNIRLASGETFGTGVFGNSSTTLTSYACGLYISQGSLRGPCVWGNTSTATCQVTVQYTKITD